MLTRKILPAVLSALLLTGCTARAPEAPPEEPPAQEESSAPELTADTSQPEFLVFVDYTVPELGFALTYPKDAVHGADEANPHIYSFHHDSFPMVAIARTEPSFDLPLNEETAEALLQKMRDYYAEKGPVLESKVTHVQDDIWLIDLIRETEAETGPVRVYQRYITNRQYAWDVHIPVPIAEAPDLEEDVLHVLNSFALLVTMP